MSKPEYAVVVSSCDAFRDLWPVFFHFWFHEAEELPAPVYLIANRCTYVDERVRTVTVGEDRHWGSNLLTVLGQLETDYILYVQDDYLLQAPAPQEMLRQGVAFLRGTGGHFLNVYDRVVEGEATGHPDFLQILPSMKWMVHLQAALWRRASLQEMITPGETPWEAESSFNRQGKQRQTGFFGLNVPPAESLAYVQGIRGSFWKADAVAFCRERGVEPNLRRRPCPPSGSGWKWYRSFLKWKMRRRRRREGDLAEEVHPLRIAR
jgi:hypothetical protein